MISVGSRDERKGLGLGIEMEETELEEGEAACHDDVNEDSTIDPDIALSYIEEKLQNVLGHFQKDFEGGVSAEKLGAKFGGYGSFLPTYQRSPSLSLTKSPPEIHKHNRARSPRKLHLEDPRQNLVATSSASLSANPRAASGKTESTGNSLKGNVYLPARHAEESTSKCGFMKNSVDPSEQRTLKVRIKVGSKNLLAQKNAEIYSGLGLVVSPSSSLDDSPTTSEGLCGNPLDEPKGSPTSILQIMTSFPVGLLLSPLSEDLIHLTDKENLGEKSEFTPMDKTHVDSSEMSVNGSLSSRSNQKVLELKNNGDQNSTGCLLKKETDINSLGCEELATGVPVSAAEDEVKGDTFSIIKKKYLGSVPAQDICRVEKLGGRLGSSGKVLESRKGNVVSSIASGTQKDVLKAEKAYASDQSESNVSNENKARRAEVSDPPKQLVLQKGGSASEEGLKVDLEKSSLRGKKKQKGVRCIDAQGAYVPRDQLMVDSSMTPKSGKSSHDLKNDYEKPGDRYKDFFGDLEFEDENNESISGEITSSERLKDPHLVGKRSISEYHSASKEKCNGKSAEKPYPPEKYPRVAPPLGNGQSSDPPTGTDALKEDWVSCDKCQTWRLLPLGTNPKSLPDKWLCKMLTWLPGMNRCSIPEEETTDALRALYHPATSVAAPMSESQNNLLNNSVGKPVGVPLIDARYPGQEYLNIAVQTETISGKRRHGSTDAVISTDLDGHTQSSNSQKKNLQASGRNSNPDRENHSPSVDASGYQHLIQSSTVADKHKDNRKDKKASLTNFSDGGTNSKIRSKRESDLDDSRVSKRIKCENGHFDDEKCISENGGGDTLKAGSSSTSSLSNNISGNDWHKYTNHKKKKSAGSDLDRVNIKAGDFSREFLNCMHSREEKSKSTRNKFMDKAGTPVRAEKNLIGKKDAAGGTLSDSKKGESQLQLGGHHVQDVIKSQDNRHNLHLQRDNEKLPKKSHRAEVHGGRNSHSLPPLARVQTETVDGLQPVSGSQKENVVKVLAVDAFENDGALMAPNQSGKSENQDGQPISIRHPIPNTHKVRNVEAPSPVRRDSSCHAANNAMKEAKDLKHLADRLKLNSGSTESIGLYFQAALKFLHGAYLLEPRNSEGIKQSEMALSMNIYSSTAKLCEFCAHEYEKSRDMASAALAYKCTEVAYMRVAYYSNTSASRDRNDLQTALQIVPPGESPSSSASELDNLNNLATTYKAALTKVGSPQVSGSHIITSLNRSGLSRLLNFAQDITFAMEASRKSRIVFAAATSRLGETQHREGILLLKKTLDFHFQDVEGLLRLVRVAMEAIGR